MFKARPAVNAVLALIVVAATLSLQFPASALGQPGVEASLPPSGAFAESSLTRLPGHVPSLLAQAVPAAATTDAADGPQTISFSVVLRRTDEAGFQDYLQAVHDPRSSSYRQFIRRPADLAQRFGPSQQAYDAVATYLRQHGFTQVNGSEDRLLISAQGTRDRLNRVMATEIQDYLLNGRVIFANSADPVVPGALASSIVGIGGLNNISMAQPARTREQPSDDVADAPLAGPAALSTPAPLLGSRSEPQVRRRDTATPGPGTPTATPRPGSYSVSDVARAYNVPGVLLPNGSPATGAGQNIALVEYSTFNGTNISNWATSTVGPCLTPGTQATCVSNLMSRLTVIPVGSSLGASATAIPTPALDQANACPSTAPASQPNFCPGETNMDIVAVMGMAPGANYQVYQNNFGTNNDLFVMLQTMIQNGANVITSSWSGCDRQATVNEATMLNQLISQAAALGISTFVSAFADPGIIYPTGADAHLVFGQGGTSLATPLWAGGIAVVNGALGSPTGALLPALYNLAGTNAFHGPATMQPVPSVPGGGNDFKHVGLGSPNFGALAALLASTATRTATPGPSQTPTVHPGTQTAIIQTTTVQALTATATPTIHPLTQTAIVLTATIQALTATATPTIHPLTQTAVAQTATIQALTATATPTLHPGTQTAIVQTATIQALTATATPTLEARTATAAALTATVLAQTRTPTPTLSLPPITASGTPGVPCTTTIGGTCNVTGGVTGTWIRTSSGVFRVTGTAPAGALAGIPAIQLPTTVNAGGETFFNACSAVTGPGSTTTCSGTTTGDVLQGATIVITYPNPFLAGVTSTGTATGANSANNLTAAQAQTQAQGTAGFLIATVGPPCAVIVGQTCTVAGAVTGTLTRSGGMTFTLTTTVPAGLIAGITPVAVFSTEGGIQAVACAAPTAGAGGTVFTCTGTITGNALQGSSAALCFTAATTCLLGTVTGPGPVLPINNLPLLPPPPVRFLPPPPPPLLPPPPAQLPPLPAMGPGGGPAAAAAPGIPVIPEAESLLLLTLGLGAVGLLVQRRRRH